MRGRFASLYYESMKKLIYVFLLCLTMTTKVYANETIIVDAKTGEIYESIDDALKDTELESEVQETEVQETEVQETEVQDTEVQDTEVSTETIEVEESEESSSSTVKTYATKELFPLQSKEVMTEDSSDYLNERMEETEHTNRVMGTCIVVVVLITLVTGILVKVLRK